MKNKRLGTNPKWMRKREQSPATPKFLARFPGNEGTILETEEEE